MSIETDLKDECVRILSELLPALSRTALSPRADNLAGLASNVLAKLGAELENIARGSVEAEDWAKAVLAEREPKDTEQPPEPASFVFRDADWPAPSPFALLHGVSEWTPVLDAPLPDGATPSEAAAQVNALHQLLHDTEPPPAGEQALQELRDAIATHLGWRTPAQEEAADYVARVVEVGDLLRRERAAVYNLGRQARTAGKVAEDEANRIGLELAGVVAYPKAGQ
jgi:hypothetical protein